MAAAAKAAVPHPPPTAAPASAAASPAAAAGAPHVEYERQCDVCKVHVNKQLLKSLANRESHVDLSKNVVGKNGVLPLVRALRNATFVTKLTLKSNFLVNESVAEIVEQLQNHPTLASLDLSGNPISHAGGKALLSYARQTPSLREIGLRDTLINAALVRMIEAQCGANANPGAVAPSSTAATATSSSTLQHSSSGAHTVPKFPIVSSVLRQYVSAVQHPALACLLSAVGEPVPGTDPADADGTYERDLAGLALLESLMVDAHVRTSEDALFAIVEASRRPPEALTACLACCETDTAGALVDKDSGKRLDGLALLKTAL